MFCTHCQRQFNDKNTTPRLLIVCGHTLCESCCYRLHNNSRVECPECFSSTFIESIGLLPKNLALISRQSSRDMCARHHKKYEAFCEKENVLICIECILQDGHKNHEMDSVHNSHQKYMGLWNKKMQKIIKFGQRSSNFLSETKEIYQNYKESYESVKQNVSLFFKQIREAIDREEDNVLSKLRQTYNQNQNKFEQKIKNTSESIDTFSSLIEQLINYEQLNETNFLQTFAERQELYNSFSQQMEESVKCTALTFSKKASTDALNKTFQALTGEKTEKKQSTIASSYNSISNQIKKNNEPTNIKAVRKMPITPSSVTVQARKKVSTKKQTHTPTNQSTNQACIVINRKTPSSKEQNEVNCRQLASQIQADISGVDPKQSLCHSFISNMTSFLTQRKSIYLIGGFNEQANNIVKLNLFSFNWEEVCPLNSNRSKFGCVATDKQIYIFGGKKGKERVGDSEVFSIASNRWTKASGISKKRSGFSVISIGELLYFIGGNDGDSILNTVQTLNITTNEWRRKEGMNEARDQLSVVVSKNKIYAIGGFGGKDNQPLKTVEVYDPTTDKWKMIPSMNQHRRALAAAVLADGIYAIGGFDGTTYLNSVEKYEENAKQWIFVASMNQSRCTHSAVSIFESQQIYVFGGFDYVPLDSVERYNIISNEWEPICRMPTVRFMHSSLLLRDD